MAKKHKPKKSKNRRTVQVVFQALFSVYYKDGIVDLGRAVIDLGGQIVSSGGTATTLTAAEVKCKTVESVTRFPAMLGGRVKTLHPKIFAAILAKLIDDHEAELTKYGINRTKLVCVNLYPVWEALAKEGVTVAEVMELVDIGGVALLRAAAKNFDNGVIVVCDPSNYNALPTPSRLAKVRSATSSDGNWRRKPLP